MAGMRIRMPAFFVLCPVSSRKRARRPIAPLKPSPPPAIGVGVDCVRALSLTTAAAIAERWLFGRAWGESHALTSAFYYGDAPRFVEYAKAILQGRVFDNGIPFHPPGWPLLLAAFLRLCGAVQHGAVVVPVAAVKLFIAVPQRVERRPRRRCWRSRSPAPGRCWPSSLLGVFQFGHIVEGTVANSEALYGLCVDRGDAGRVAVASAATRAVRWPWAALAGAVARLRDARARGVSRRAPSLIGLVAWRAKARRAVDRRVRVAFCVVLMPTTVWHWRTLKAFNVAHVGRVAGPLPRFAPVTSYGPFNFAMANHARTPTAVRTAIIRCSIGAIRRPTSACPPGSSISQCPAVYDLYVHGYTIGALWIVENPGARARADGPEDRRHDRLSRARLLHRRLGAWRRRHAAARGSGRSRGAMAVADSPDPAAVRASCSSGSTAVALGLLAAPMAALLASALLFYGYVRLGAAYRRCCGF